MKNFSKNGAKFAAAIAMSVMALGYTTSVWADESAGITKEETVFKNIKGTQTEILNDILYRSNKADEVKATALDIHDVEKKNFINSDQDGLFIGCQAMAYKNAEGIGVHVKDSQADFKIKGNFVVQASGVISEKEEEASGVIGGTEENVSMKAVGFYGENGSSQIEANSVSYTVKNEYPSGIHTGMLDEEMQGIYANNYNINILAKNDIEISYWIPETLSGTMTAQGMILSNGSKASLQAGGKIQIGDGSGFTRNNNLTAINTSNSNLAAISASNSNLAAINASESTLDIKAKNGIEIVAVNKDAVGAIQNENVYAIYAEKSAIALDGGNGGISIHGNVNVLDNSTLKLSGMTSIDGKILGTGMPGSNLTVKNSTLVVDGFVATSGTTTLNNAKIYMYDTNNTEAGFHALQIKNLDIAGSNELFLRADSSKAAGNIGRFELNSDVIEIKGIETTPTTPTTITTPTTTTTTTTTTTIPVAGQFDVNVFDKGMKNGYGMGTDGEITLDKPITVLYNSNYSTTSDFLSLINSVKVTNYDNGIWSYTYEMNADQDGNGNVVIKKVDVKAAPSASGSQRSLHSANKAAGALAIGVLGNDNALHAHLREAQGAGEREEVWAQYLGGKLKADGVQLKHNGVELGYDAYVGSNWTFGVSGMQTRGNTQLDSGSGKAKTNVGTVYGAWHGGSTYLNLEAKAGRVSSESKTFGGTVLQKIAGEFSAPAYSVSAEYGSTHELPAAWYLEPAVRLSYVHLGAADYGVQVQDTLARVANDSLDSFILRGGAKLGRRLGAKGSFYVKAAAVYDFGGDLATTVSADGRTAYDEGDLGGWGLEYGAGLEYKLGQAANISLDFERRSGGELKRDWGVNVGVNYSF